MLCFHIIQTVSHDAARISSYLPGQRIVQCAFATREKAEQTADSWNTHVAIPGITYVVGEYDDTVEPTLPII